MSESHSLVAEQALLGACLARNGAMMDLVEDAGLRARHFYDPLHQNIFTAWRSLARAGQVADEVTLAQPLADNAALAHMNETEGTPYLAWLASSPAAAGDARDYARLICEHAERRALADIARDLAIAAEGADSPDAVRADAIAKLDAREAASGPALTALGAALNKSMEDAAAAYESGLGVPADAVLTGWSEFDAATGGMRPSELIALAGRPGMGKSLLGFEIARRVAERGDGVLFFALEMPADQYAARLIGASSNVSYSAFARGVVDAGEFERARDAALSQAELPIFFDERPGLSPAEVRATVRRAQRRLGERLKLVIIDHAGKMRGQGASTYQQTSHVWDELLEMARASKLPVLALNQLNRQVEQRGNKRPMLSDLRDSGSIEENSTKVWFVYRDAYYAALEPMSDEADAEADRQHRAQSPVLEINIAKNRNGPTKLVEMHADVTTGLVREIADRRSL